MTDSLDATFSALADPTRRAIVGGAGQGEATVLELAEPFTMSLPAVSKHLKVLERAGLIARGRDAQRSPAALRPGPLKEVRRIRGAATANTGRRASIAWMAISRR